MAFDINILSINFAYLGTGDDVPSKPMISDNKRMRIAFGLETQVDDILRARMIAAIDKETLQTEKSRMELRRIYRYIMVFKLQNGIS